MESGISHLQGIGISGNGLNVLLFAILNESLDEDLIAVKHFTELSDTSLADKFRSELNDFINIGRFVTLKEYDRLEDAGSIMIDRYTDEDNITDTLSNLYLKAENEQYIPVFQKLLIRAKERYPSSLPLETLNGFINMKGKDYQKALDSFITIKDRLEQDHDNEHYNYNLASTWDNIAACYLKLGDAAKTIESCDIALDYDAKAEDFKVGHSILSKKAEALLLTDDKA
jgi:tetratricopeptide (TPR) repeat protein